MVLKQISKFKNFKFKKKKDVNNLSIKDLGIVYIDAYKKNKKPPLLFIGLKEQTYELNQYHKKILESKTKFKPISEYDNEVYIFENMLETYAKKYYRFY